MIEVRNLLLCWVAVSIAACVSAPVSVGDDESWGLMLEPIDYWAGSDDDQIVVWHGRVAPEIYRSETACLQAAKELAKAYPPGKNMHLTCTTPHPDYNEIDVPIDMDEIALE